MKTYRLTASAFVLAGSLSLLQAGPVGAQEGADKAKSNYQSYCRKCHGDQGKGDGPGALMLSPKPRDFSDCAAMQKRSDDELLKVVTEGGQAAGMSADMQAWSGTLSEQEIQDLVKYVRSFCKKP